MLARGVHDLRQQCGFVPASPLLQWLDCSIKQVSKFCGQTVSVAPNQCTVAMVHRWDHSPITDRECHAAAPPCSSTALTTCAVQLPRRGACPSVLRPACGAGTAAQLSAMPGGHCLHEAYPSWPDAASPHHASPWQHVLAACYFRAPSPLPLP